MRRISKWDKYQEFAILGTTNQLIPLWSKYGRVTSDLILKMNDLLFFQGIILVNSNFALVVIINYSIILSNAHVIILFIAPKCLTVNEWFIEQRIINKSDSSH